MPTDIIDQAGDSTFTLTGKTVTAIRLWSPGCGGEAVAAGKGGGSGMYGELTGLSLTAITDPDGLKVSVTTGAIYGSGIQKYTTVTGLSKGSTINLKVGSSNSNAGGTYFSEGFTTIKYGQNGGSGYPGGGGGGGGGGVNISGSGDGTPGEDAGLTYAGEGGKFGGGAGGDPGHDGNGAWTNSAGGGGPGSGRLLPDPGRGGAGRVEFDYDLPPPQVCPAALYMAVNSGELAHD